MTSALLALLGVVVGALVNEFFRKQHRIENYSQPLFEKRLRLYEELYRKVCAGSGVAEDVIANPTYSADKRKELISGVVLDLAEFCDDNSFYLDEEITLHAVGIFMGVEDVQELKSKQKKNQEIARFRENRAQAYKMIRDEAGMSEFHKLFRSITKAQPSSDLIEYFRAAKERKR